MVTLNVSAMRKIYLLVLSLVVSVACSEQPAGDEFLEEVTLKSAQKVMVFKAHLDGNSEVPPVETLATGQAVFMLSKDGETLNYKLIVANIEDVRMSHIHLAPEGANGAVVVWLYPSGPPPMTIEGKTNGILAEGAITMESLVGELAGEPLSALIDQIKAGNAYVNVHTVTNGGGEIRGQISGN